jgi:tetratricopeptide (TPR) repeat protein
MVEKYGEAFYSLWSPWEQQRYATLRLAKDDLENLGRPGRYKPWAVVSLSVAVVLLAVLAVTQPLQESPRSSQVVQDDPNRQTQVPGAKRPADPPAIAEIDKADDEPRSPGNVQHSNEPADPPAVAESNKAPSPPLPPPQESNRLQRAPRKLAAETVRQAKRLDKEGRDLFAARKYIQAGKRFQEIIKLGHATAATHNNLGCCLYRTTSGNQAPAIAQFSKAITLDPKNLTVFNNRGTAYFQDPKQHKAGQDDFTAVADLDVKRRLEKPGTPSGGFFDLKQSRTSTRFRPTLRKRYSSVRVSTRQGRTAVRRP